jgi:hypothetical protein
VGLVERIQYVSSGTDGAQRIWRALGHERPTEAADPDIDRALVSHFVVFADALDQGGARKDLIGMLKKVREQP